MKYLDYEHESITGKPARKAAASDIDRVVAALHDMADALKSDKRQQVVIPPANVEVTVPQPYVEVTVPPANVKVEVPKHVPQSYSFKVVRDLNQRIQEIIATPVSK